MTCGNREVKDMLPSYLEKGLDADEQRRIGEHLESCADCRGDLALLRLMAEDAVPDPGEAFWASMPGRVYRAVQDEKNRRKVFDLASLGNFMRRYRLPAAIAAAGLVLVVSLVTVQRPQPVRNASESTMSEYAEDAAVADADDVVQVADLSADELSRVGSWAGSELEAQAPDIDLAVMNGTEPDIYEELAELTSSEMRTLSKRISQWSEEG